MSYYPRRTAIVAGGFIWRVGKMSTVLLNGRFAGWVMEAWMIGDIAVYFDHNPANS